MEYARFGFGARCGLGCSILAMSLMAAAAAGPRTFSDDFSSPGNGAPPRWEAQSAWWTMKEGAYLADEGASVWSEVPWAGSLHFACDITVLELLGGDWLTAGIGVQADDGNFWALNLVAAPETQQRRHFAELHEMLAGTWQAQHQPETGLEALPGRGANLNWQRGETYRLAVDLTASNIVGRVLHRSTEVARFGYQLSNPAQRAVRVGRPMVRASGLRVRFDNATATVHLSAAGPKQEPRPQVPWISRPGKPLAKATGFFRTAQLDGRWWLLDPEGKPFFDVGTDHISYRGHWCESLGYSPYYRNMVAKYGSEAEWARETLERLKAWNFNVLPAGHSPSLRRQGLAHIEFASFGSAFARREWICRPIHWTGFPDVFSPRWEAHCRLTAQRLAEESRGDPWCLGTFLDNELEWYGKNGHLVDEVFQLGPQSPAKQAFYEWLLREWNDLAGLNRHLGTAYANGAAFLSATNVPPPGPGLERAREGFLAVIAERYFSVACRALREADPHHLVLGCRFAGQAPAAALGPAGKHNDIFTINAYPRVDFENTWLPNGVGGVVEGVPRLLRDYYAAAAKPMLITEWSFPALDSGLPCRHGAGMRVDTQDQKAECYRIFARAMADLPFVVGYHYFMWVDEPALGISSTFPEDSNYGLVDEKGTPYAKFTQVVTEVNAHAAEWHRRSSLSGSLEFVARSAGVELRNTNHIASHGHLRITARERSQVLEVRLPPGGRQQFPIPDDAPWCAELQGWDGTKRRVTGGKLPTGPVSLMNISNGRLSRVPFVVETPGLAAGLLDVHAGKVASPPTRATVLERRDRLDLRCAGSVWSCDLKTGALFDHIEAGGLALGRLVFAVHQKVEGKSYWAESSRVLQIQTQEHPEVWLVEAEVENPGAPGGPAGFRARVRAIVFKELGLALVKPLWVTSLDSRDWDLVEAYWFCRQSIGGSSDGDVVGGPAVPNYYRAAHFITDRKLGGCFGALHQPEGWRVTFWTNPEGGIHPDSRYPVGQQMKTGMKWEPRQGVVPFLWIYASRQAEGWKDFSEASTKASRSLVRTQAPSA